MSEEIRLTEFSKGAGCGCKISPAVLREILMVDDEIPADPKLIVGNESNDDASVYSLGNGECLVNTTDFFMPVVNNAYDFGRIASCNAFSDIYAMGGRPLTALAILGWPVDKIQPSIARRVLEGARFMCRMAGITLAGGHSIESAEPIFGLSVSGIVSEINLKRNNTAKTGDLLFISKPLGAGVITTAHKRGVVSDEHFNYALSQMCTLNKMGEVLGRIPGINAMTDVTGFGLLGHLVEMCDGSAVSAEIDFGKIPVYPFLGEYLDKFIYPDMTMKNFNFYSSRVTEMNARQLFTMCDPQTSGGLLVSVEPGSVDDYLDVVQAFGLQGIANQTIGQMVSQKDKAVLFS